MYDFTLDQFSELKLLILLLQPNTDEEEQQLAAELERHGSIPQVMAAQNYPTQLRYHAAVELYRRQLHPKPGATIHNPEDTFAQVADMGLLTQEQMRVLLLDTHQQVKAIHTTHIGTAALLVARTSEILLPAVLANAPYIIVAHNHPGGQAQPSAHDIVATEQIAAAAKLLDIVVLDHMIVAGATWYSFAEKQPELLGLEEQRETQP